MSLPHQETALPGLLPTVWLAATAIIGVNASAFRGLSSIIWLSYQTVRFYLSAVRHLQILCIGRDPSLEAHPLLNYLLRGLHRSPVGKKPRPCLPITPAILQEIFQFWSLTPHQFEYILLWAAFCLGFFGFMRSGKFTCPSMSAVTSDMLTAQDISVDSRAHLSYNVVWLKRSKNDPFALQTRVCIGTTNLSVCPVTALLGYLGICPNRMGLHNCDRGLSRPFAKFCRMWV